MQCCHPYIYIHSYLNDCRLQSWMATVQNGAAPLVLCIPVECLNVCDWSCSVNSTTSRVPVVITMHVSTSSSHISAGFMIQLH